MTVARNPRANGRERRPDESAIRRGLRGRAAALTGALAALLLVQGGCESEPRAQAAAAPAVTAEQITQVVELMARARQSMRERAWDRALEALDRATRVAEGDAVQTRHIEAMRAEAELGKTQKAAFEGLRRAVAAGDLAAVVDRLAQTPPGSVYRDDALRVIEGARDRLLGLVKARADALARSSACDDLAAWIDQVEPAVPQAREHVSEVIASCGKPRRAAGEADPRELEALVAEARAALLKDDLASALASCQQVLRLDRNHAEATMLCAITVCKQRDGGQARRYYQRLRSKAQRSRVSQICLMQGDIKLPPP